MDRYIFLDIDGVLNCEQTFKNTPKYQSHLDEKMVERLKYLVDMTGAKIIISSSWRLSSGSMDDLLTVFDKYNLHISGVTPDNFDCRAKQIKDWLDKHIRNSFEYRIVILDDDEIEEPMREYQVKTSWSGKHGGLQNSHIEKCLKYLGY